MPAKKGKKKLTRKQKKLVEALTKVDTVAEAGRMAGFETRQAAHQALKRIQETIPELMKRLGADDEYLIAETLRRSKELKTTEHFAHQGVVIDSKEKDDNGGQWRYHDALLKIRGIYKTPENVGDGQSNSTTIGFRLVVSDTRESAAIARLLSAGSPSNVVIDVDATVHQDVG